MAEITWRNVNQRDNNGAIALMNAAQSSINAGLNSFGGIIKDRQQVNAGNFAVGQDALKQSLMDQVNSFKSVDDYAAAQQSGQIDQMLGGIVNPAMRREVQAAADARMGTLRNQEVADYDFTQGRADRAAAPVMNDVRRRALADQIQGWDDLTPEEQGILGAANLGFDFEQFAAQTNAQEENERRSKYTHDRAVAEDERTDSERAKAELYDNIANTTLNSVLDEQAAFNTEGTIDRQNQVMEKYGAVPSIFSPGGFDTSRMTPEGIESALAEIQGIVDSPLTTTETRGELQNRLRTERLPPEVVLQKLAEFDALKAQEGNISQEDEARVASMVDSQHRQLEIAKGGYEAEENQDTKGLALEALFEALPGSKDLQDTMYWNGSKKAMADNVVKAASEGIEISVNGQKTKVPLTLARIKHVLTRYGENINRKSKADIDTAFQEVALEASKEWENWNKFRHFRDSQTSMLYDYVNKNSPGSQYANELRALLIP